MPICHYVGASTEIGGVAEGDTALSKFGQEVELSDDLFKDVLMGGGAVLPKPIFDKLAFTEQECSIYGDAYTHAAAHPAFLEKKHQALLAVHELRVRIGNQEPLDEAADAVKDQMPDAQPVKEPTDA